MNIKQITALTTTTTSLIFSAGAIAENILLAGPQGVVQQLDTITGEVTFRGVCSGPVSSMVVNGTTLYLGDPNGLVYTYDTTSDLLNGSFFVDSNASAMSWIGDQIVIADSSGEVLYIDSTTHVVEDSITVTGTDITTIGFDAGGLFAGGHSSLAMRTHIGHDNFQLFAACGSEINSMAFGADFMYVGGTAFFGATTGSVYVFDKFVGGNQYYAEFGVDSDITSMVRSGDMLYIAGSDGLIHEMNPSNGIITRVFDTGLHISAMTPENGLVSCPADYDASGQLDFLDVSQFIELFVNQHVPGDTNGDGQFNFFDVSEFLRIYSSGC